MIELSGWKTHSVKDIHLDSYPKKYEIGLTFEGNRDARTDWSRRFIEKTCNIVINVEYNANDAELKINNDIYSIRSLNDYRLPEGEILVDGTSLSLPELLHVFTMLNSKQRSFDVSYIQPSTYKEDESRTDYNTTAYDLSDDGLGVQQLPPFVGTSNNSRILFFLGWEGHRLGALIHSDELNIMDLTCIAGIPSYQVGWENTTLSCNFMNIKELLGATPTFRFSGANDPVRTYKIIQEVYASTTYRNHSLSIAAFGTKPSAIAAAQFAVNNAETSKGQKQELIMLYDFVKIKSDRSQGMSTMHIWSFDYRSQITS